MQSHNSSGTGHHLVLLGDSIFDNAAYVAEGDAVIHHLRQAIPGGWKASLLAVDGSVATDVPAQTLRIPPSATHLVLSTGGNDALGALWVFTERVQTVQAALLELGRIRDQFRQAYRHALARVLECELPAIVCTIYNAVPGLDMQSATALALFNEVILEEAFRAGLPVIDLRVLCAESCDYSEISPIEPSSVGGKKIANAIVKLLSAHDFDANTSTVLGRAN